jgi:uncharacterized protein YegL
MNDMNGLPGGAVSKRPLHFIFLLDASGSMTNGTKIQSLNTAIREAIAAIQEVAEMNPGVELLVRAIKFGSRPQWHTEQAVRVRDFVWRDITAGGETAMGEALKTAAQVLTPDQVGKRALPPVLVLVSDGLPTDDFAGGLRTMMAQPWGKQAIRLAVAIGQDADEEILRQFIGRDDIPVVRANAPQMLVERIKLVSVTAVQSSSTGGDARGEQLREELTAHAPVSGAGSVW